MPGTLPGAHAGAVTEEDTSEGTCSDTEETPQPPCRVAQQYIVACPRCGRRVRLKTLKYSHVCGRSFNIIDRANEQQVAADAALNARMRLLEQTPARRVQNTATAAPVQVNKKDYTKLLNF